MNAASSSPSRPLPVATGDDNPIGVLWWGSAGPAVIAVALTAAGATFSAPADGASVLVGATMALTALSVGPVLHRICRRLDPMVVMGLAIMAYCLVIGLLGMAYGIVNDVDWLIGGFAGTGVAVTVVAWALGHMRAARRLRQPLYDQRGASAGR